MACLSDRGLRTEETGDRPVPRLPSSMGGTGSEGRCFPEP